MAGKGMRPEAGRDLEAYAAGHDYIDWGRKPSAEEDAPKPEAKPKQVSEREAKKQHCNERGYRHGLA